MSNILDSEMRGSLEHVHTVHYSHEALMNDEIDVDGGVLDIIHDTDHTYLPVPVMSRTCIPFLRDSPALPQPCFTEHTTRTQYSLPPEQLRPSEKQREEANVRMSLALWKKRKRGSRDTNRDFTNRPLKGMSKVPKINDDGSNRQFTNKAFSKLFHSRVKHEEVAMSHQPAEVVKLVPRTVPLETETQEPDAVPLETETQETDTVPKPEDVVETVPSTSKEDGPAPNVEVEQQTVDVVDSSSHDYRGDAVIQDVFEEAVTSDWDVPDGHDRKCKTCGVTLPHLEMLEHIRALHRPTAARRGFPVRPCGLMLCPFPHCRSTVPDYGYLVAHLLAFHNLRQFSSEDKSFPNEEAYKAWRREYEEKHGKLIEQPTCLFDSDGNQVENTFYLTCGLQQGWKDRFELGGRMAEKTPCVTCPAAFHQMKMEDGSIFLHGVFNHLGHKKFPNLIGAPKGSKEPLFFKNFRCPTCRHFFMDKHSLEYHQKVRHGINSMIGHTTKRTNIACAACDATFDTMLFYVRHVASLHRNLITQMMLQEIQFDNYNAFEEWKYQYEMDNCTQFVCASGKVRLDSQRTIHQYLICHRSGHHSGKLRGLRRRQSKKINAFCTAFLNATINGNGTVHVRCCLDHFGHECEPHNLPMSKILKVRVEQMLKEGMTMETIKFVITSQSHPTDRSHYLKRYEIVNIAKRLAKAEGYLIINDMLVPPNAVEILDNPSMANDPYQGAWQRYLKELDEREKGERKNYVKNPNPPEPVAYMTLDGRTYEYRDSTLARESMANYVLGNEDDDFPTQYVDATTFNMEQVQGFDESDALNVMLSMNSERRDTQISKDHVQHIEPVASMSTAQPTTQVGEQEQGQHQNQNQEQTDAEQDVAEEGVSGALAMKNQPDPESIPRATPAAQAVYNKKRRIAPFTLDNPSTSTSTHRIMSSNPYLMEQSSKSKPPVLRLPERYSIGESDEVFGLKLRLQELRDQLRYVKDSERQEELLHLKDLLERDIARLIGQTKSMGTMGVLLSEHNAALGHLINEQQGVIHHNTAEGEQYTYIMDNTQVPYEELEYVDNEIIEYGDVQYIYEDDRQELQEMAEGSHQPVHGDQHQDHQVAEHHIDEHLVDVVDIEQGGTEDEGEGQEQ